MKSPWFVSTLTGTGIMTTFLLRNNISPIVPALRQQFNLTDFQLGIILSSFLWVYTALQPFAGWATDRYGARATLLAGVLASSVITVLTGFATSLLALVGARIILGVAQSPNFVTGAKVSSSAWVGDQYRARATSGWIAGGRLGTAIALPLAAFLSFLWGWQWAFFGTGLIGFAWCATWFLGYNNHPSDEQFIGRRNHNSGTWRQSLPILMSPLGLGLALASFGQGYLAYYVSTWLPDYLVREQKLTILDAGLVATLPILAAVAGILVVGGFFSDYRVKKGSSRVGFRTELFALGMIIASILLFMTAYARSISSITGLTYFSSPSFAISSLSIAGFAWGIATPSLWSALVEATPKQVTGSMGGIQNLGGNLGGILVLLLTGYILQQTGQSVFALTAVSAFALISAGSALLLVRPAREISKSVAAGGIESFVRETSR